MREGDHAADVYFLAAGSATARLRARQDATGGTGSVQGRRLRSFGAGVAFGEAALCERARRTADVIADCPVICRVLNVADLRALAQEHPHVYAKVLIGSELRSSRFPCHAAIGVVLAAAPNTSTSSCTGPFRSRSRSVG